MSDSDSIWINRLKRAVYETIDNEDSDNGEKHFFRVGGESRDIGGASRLETLASAARIPRLPGPRREHGGSTVPRRALPAERLESHRRGPAAGDSNDPERRGVWKSLVSVRLQFEPPDLASPSQNHEILADLIAAVRIQLGMQAGNRPGEGCSASCKIHALHETLRLKMRPFLRTEYFCPAYVFRRPHRAGS